VTSIGDLAATFDKEHDTSNTLSALVLATLGSAGASVLLGAASVLAMRRRDVTNVLRARGASTARLALIRAGEAVLMVVPGLLVAALLVGSSPVTRGDLLPAAAVAAACVLLLATVQVAPPREQSGRWGLALRDASQIVVIVLAVIVVAVMLGRDRARATDPLVLLLPAVVSVAAGVVAVRAAQWLMTPLRRVAAASSEQVAPVVGVSGAAAAAPRVMLPVIAVVLAGAGALLAQGVDDTLDRGADLAGWQSVGADVAISGALLDDPLARRIEELPGVSSVAAVRTVVGSLDTRVGPRQVTVVAVDAEALEKVVQDSAQPLDVPSSDGDGPLGALVSGDLDLAGGETTLTYAQASVPVTVTGRLDRVPGLPTVEPFVLVERQPFEAASDRTLGRYETMLVSGSPDPGAVAAAAHEVSPDAAVRARTEVAAEALDGQVVRRIRVVVGAAAIASAVLALFAVALAIELGRPLRRRTAALLRALGAGRRSARWVSAFELLPVMAAAGLLSLGCGIVLMAVSDRTIDVGALTGAREREPVGLDPLSWLVAGLLLAALVLGVAVASAWRGARRYGRAQSDEMDMG
jgi:putative ABC transport system permease protein